MQPPHPSTPPVQFHLLSFEGPDPYARAGGLASRIDGLSRELAASGFPTHLWFVGDPDRPGEEEQDGLTLHRWCQWISHHHRQGVYAGEEGKVSDYAASAPPCLFGRFVEPHLVRGGRAVVLAEEWQTVGAVFHLDALLRGRGLRDRVRIFWNANNPFGFDRIDWQRLAAAATITTVSRFMKQLMWPLGVDPVAIPNGLSPDAYLPADGAAVRELRRRFRDRTMLAKMARFDPDKRWLLAIDTVAELRRQGLRPILIARGGMESHGEEVLRRAANAGLQVIERESSPGADGLLQALSDVNGADVVSLRSHVDSEARRVLFRGSDAVLANSGREPFGLVGLEAMAVGGVACTGATGEDYAEPGRNALVLQTSDPQEFVALFRHLRADRSRERALRRAGRHTARRYAWPEVLRRDLVPRLEAAHA